jgi:hypothetical protein
MMTKTRPGERRGARKSGEISKHAAALDWAGISSELDAHGCARIGSLLAPGRVGPLLHGYSEDGCATIGSLLAPEECAAIADLYPADEHFRSRVVMSRHGFGRGEYKYFAYPLPPIIAALRASLYPPLAQVANRWHEALKNEVRFPAEHAAFLARCHAAGQVRPTPLLLHRLARVRTLTQRLFEISSFSSVVGPSLVAIAMQMQSTVSQSRLNAVTRSTSDQAMENSSAGVGLVWLTANPAASTEMP